jgi:transposase
VIDDHWSPREDEALFDAVGKGLSMAQIAAQIGRTRNACISRYNRKLVSKPKQWIEPPENFAQFAYTETSDELQARYHTTSTRIAQWRKATGIASPAQRLNIPPDLARLCRNNTQAALGRHYGVSHHTVGRWLSAAGLSALKRYPNNHYSGKNVVAIDSRDGSLATRAQSHLQRFVSVWRCTPEGAFDPKGSHFQVGRIVLTAGEMILRAERKGFDPTEWTRLAA